MTEQGQELQTPEQGQELQTPEQGQELQTPEQEQVPSEQEQVEAKTLERAKEMGYREDYKGDRPVTPEEYVRRGETVIPIIKSRLKKYEGTIGTLQAELESQKEVTQKLLKVSGKAAERAYEKAHADILAEQKLAVENSDVDSWQKLEEDKAKLEKPEPVAPAAPAEIPEFTAFKARNDWYDKDQELGDYAKFAANDIAQRLQSGQLGQMTNAQFYQAVEDRVRGTFQHKFKNPNKDAPSAVDSPGLRGTRVPNRKTTLRDLPKDMQAQARQYIVDGVFEDEADYLKNCEGLI